MKLKALILFGTSVMILSGCNSGEDESKNDEANQETSEESSKGETKGSEKVESDSASKDSDSGLLNLNNTEEGWINFEGELGGNSEYITSGFIEYNPESKYKLSKGGYIAYYSGEDFIKTTQQEFEGPIERVPKADQIRISFHESFEESISLTEQ
ncbi:MAG TPA: hypothetical protein VK105_07740 [Virgibacillus sp.]|nr:hypothetical protein [Virgibacillus sp.]HLR67015.1 hypothetical protein [Virgibacillus sp.]